MKRKLLLFFIVLLLYCEHVRGLRLKKVLVFSRHNIRAPLFKKLPILSPKELPKWSVEKGHLTSKGVLLESYMGGYFSAWLHKEGLIGSRCPHDESVYIIANHVDRTIKTAKAFSATAFPNCNVKVNTQNVTSAHLQQETIFPFLITNATDAFIQSGRREMQENFDRRDFTEIYEELNEISDIEDSEICKSEGLCDLTKGEDEVSFNYGEFPQILGRFQIAWALMDSYLMGFYEGFPLDDDSWGGIEDEYQWTVLVKLLNEKLKICYNLTVMRDYIRPLLKYIKEAINDERLFTLLVGHDSNLSPLVFTMGFEPHELPEQFEDFPIGSKLVFQKWTDGENDFLKVEYVYQTSVQMRDAEKLSLSNPPKNITMHFKTLNADENGMYAWSDFEEILSNLIE